MQFNKLLTLTAGTLTVLGVAALPVEADVEARQSGRPLIAQTDPESRIDLDDATRETDAHEGIGEEPGPHGSYEPDSDSDIGTRDSVPTDVQGVDEESAIDLDDATSDTDAHEGIGEEPPFSSGRPNDASIVEPSPSETGLGREGNNIDEESDIDLEDATSDTDAHEGIGEEPGY